MMLRSAVLAAVVLATTPAIFAGDYARSTPVVLQDSSESAFQVAIHFVQTTTSQSRDYTGLSAVRTRTVSGTTTLYTRTGGQPDVALAVLTSTGWMVLEDSSVWDTMIVVAE